MDVDDDDDENNEDEFGDDDESGLDWHAVNEEDEDDEYIGVQVPQATQPAQSAQPAQVPRAPPRIHSNRMNAREFRRAVWRNGQVVGRDVAEQRAGDDLMFADDYGSNGRDRGDGGEGNARTRTGLNLAQIELMATKSTVEEHEALLSENGDEEEEYDGTNGADGDSNHDSDDDSGSSSCGDGAEYCGSRPSKRRYTSHSRGDAQNTMSLGLMNTLFGGTLDSHQPESVEDARNAGDSNEPTTTHSTDSFDADTHSDANTIPTIEEPCIELEHGTCVGCELGGLVEPVDKFVIDNAHRVPSNRLWSLAHDAYKTQVVDATRMQGGGVLPDWSRVDIQRHYEFHVVDERLFRLSALRDLQGLRALCKSRILTQNSDGSQEIDSQSMKEYMSIVSMESKEHHLLSSIVANSRGFGPSSSTNAVPASRKRSSRR